MTRSKEEIQDAVALLKAMTMIVNMQGNQNLFGNALNTISAAIAEIQEEDDDIIAYWLASEANKKV
jgi:hypothetical protein